MRTRFKDQQLGVADPTLHPIGKTSGSRHVVAAECDQSWRRDPTELGLGIMGYHGVRLLHETRHRLRWAASHKVGQ